MNRPQKKEKTLIQIIIKLNLTFYFVTNYSQKLALIESSGRKIFNFIISHINQM